MSSKLRALGAIFLLCAVIMSLLVSLSIKIPNLPTVDLAQSNFDTTGKSGNLSMANTTGISEIQYSVWSACFYQGNSGDFTCLPQAVGYTFTIQLTNASQTVASATVTKAWTRLLVIHPIGAAVTFLAIPLSIAKCTISIAGVWISLLSLLIGIAAVGIDIAFIYDLKHKMSPLGINTNTAIKSGFGMWIIAVIFVLLANLCFWGSLRMERFRRLKQTQRVSTLLTK